MTNPLDPFNLHGRVDPTDVNDLVKLINCATVYALALAVALTALYTLTLPNLIHEVVYGSVVGLTVDEIACVIAVGYTSYRASRR